MKYRSVIGTCVATALGLFSYANSALCQQPSLKEQLVGTWTLVSWQQTRSDGSTFQQFGANPRGIAFFDAGGRYIISVMRSDRAKYAIGNYAQIKRATAEENRATAQGTITYFGTYSVNEPGRAISIHVEASSFPNWNGTDQKRFFDLSGDQLKLIVRPPAGGSVDVLWRRAK
jgi:Lipocalin-like domain